MILPFLQDEAFLADVEKPASSRDELRVWWLGQSGFLLQWCGGRVLLDPYLSDSLTRKYAGTDKPHVRMTERVIAPERLTGIDVVVSSHNHTDHLDAETLGPLRAANPQMQFVIPEANRAFVSERLGIDPTVPIGLDDMLWEEVAGFQFCGIAAAHNQIDRDAAGHCKYLGYVIQCGRWMIYHSGDTLRYPGLDLRVIDAGNWEIDLALLPINGNRPERRVAGNLDGREAAQLAHDIRAKLVVPCHYDLFEFNTADPRELFLTECQRLAQPHRLLRAGEVLTLG